MVRSISTCFAGPGGSSRPSWLTNRIADGPGKTILRLQRKLYLGAKAEPEFRFYRLYEEVCHQASLLGQRQLEPHARVEPRIAGERNTKTCKWDARTSALQASVLP